MSAELRDLLHQTIWEHHYDSDTGHRLAAALLDGPLRETLRLARIGAWVTDTSSLAFALSNISTEAVNRVAAYRRAALAAGAPVEPPQGDAL